MVWDFPPTYDTDVDDEDLAGNSLPYNQENRLDEVNISDTAILHEFDESPKIEEFNLGVEEFGFVDFLGVDNIFSNFPDDDFNEFYTMEEDFRFMLGEIVYPFWEIFMARKREKINGSRVKNELFMA